MQEYRYLAASTSSFVVFIVCLFLFFYVFHELREWGGEEVSHGNYEFPRISLSSIWYPDLPRRFSSRQSEIWVQDYESLSFGGGLSSDLFTNFFMCLDANRKTKYDSL